MQSIPIDAELTKFASYIQANPRCILSAKFGDGKSYFLKEFKKSFINEYYTITLHPVNYSVASNEDVFEYIKHDILKQLFEAGLLSDIDVDTLLDMALDPEEWKQIIRYLLTLIPGVEKVAKGIKLIDKINDKYNEKKKTYEKYNAYFVNQKGSIYEKDAYSLLISATIEHIREFGINGQAKKCLLVIEDMDRLDPAHLFRILNIITSHIDECSDSNKFGFDNIVLVMDYDVAESIFRHFYGDGANFQGYIQKFLSNKPFRFSITETARSYFRESFERDCGIPSKSLSLITNVGHSLNEYIDKLTVREIANILDNKDKNINNDILKVESNPTKAIRTKCTLTNFLYYCSAIDHKCKFKDNMIIEGIIKMGVDACRLCKDFFYALSVSSNGKQIICINRDVSVSIIPVENQTNNKKNQVVTNFSVQEIGYMGKTINDINTLVPSAVSKAKKYILSAE